MVLGVTTFCMKYTIAQLWGRAAPATQLQPWGGGSSGGSGERGGGERGIPGGGVLGGQGDEAVGFPQPPPDPPLSLSPCFNVIYVSQNKAPTVNGYLA